MVVNMESFELEDIKILIENYGEETTLMEIYDDLCEMYNDK